MEFLFLNRDCMHSGRSDDARGTVASTLDTGYAMPAHSTVSEQAGPKLN